MYDPFCEASSKPPGNSGDEGSSFPAVLALSVFLFGGVLLEWCIGGGWKVLFPAGFIAVICGILANERIERLRALSRESGMDADPDEAAPEDGADPDQLS